MSNYINGFVSCLCIIVLVVVVMGFQYSGTQHFSDIVANSITLVDKNGLGGVLTLVDKDGADEVSPDNFLIKGGGGAHTREKILINFKQIIKVKLAVSFF